MSRIARPYARKRGGPPSVTTVLGALAKDGLSWAAAKETARYVVEHADQVHAAIEADKEGEYEHLRKHHRGVWDFAADIGTAVHGVNEAWIEGATVDLEAVVPDRVLKAGREKDFLDRLPGYVDGLERFWIDCEPKTIAAEIVVRYNYGNDLAFIGSLDWQAVLATIGTETWLLDVKTTQEQDPAKGHYVDSWRLQLTAYNHCNEIVLYDDEANEIGTEPYVPADRCGIIHLRGDGKYQLLELDAGEAAFCSFLDVRRVYDWLRTGHKTPAPVIVRPELKVEATA